jgi:hypothetical protein
MHECTVFAGPSTHGMAGGWADDPTLDWRPPARRGDVDALLASSPRPGVLVLCDGVFKIAPAVGHAELQRAIDAGWQAWGVSSLGAIRAYELRAHGMRGFGDVYAQFDRHEDFTDDEMCLLHFPEAPWFPLSEPLVNLRHAFECQGSALGISGDAAAVVVDQLRGLWFGDRTLARMRSTMVELAGIPAPSADALLLWLTRNRAKTKDLENLLRQRPWRSESAAARTP